MNEEKLTAKSSQSDDAVLGQVNLDRPGLFKTNTEAESEFHVNNEEALIGKVESISKRNRISTGECTKVLDEKKWEMTEKNQKYDALPAKGEEDHKVSEKADEYAADMSKEENEGKFWFPKKKEEDIIIPKEEEDQGGFQEDEVSRKSEECARNVVKKYKDEEELVFSKRENLARHSLVKHATSDDGIIPMDDIATEGDVHSLAFVKNEPGEDYNGTCQEPGKYVGCLEEISNPNFSATRYYPWVNTSSAARMIFPSYRRRNLVHDFVDCTTYEVSRRLPKRMYENSVTLFSKESYQNNVIQYCLDQAKRGEIQPHRFSAELTDLDSDPGSFKLLARGTEKELEVLEKCTTKWLENLMVFRNLQRLVFDPASVELDLILDAQKSIGAKVYEKSYAEQEPVSPISYEGLWVTKLIAKGQLGQALGCTLASTHGLAILRIGIGESSLVLSRPKMMYKALAVARESGSTLIVRICIHKEFDLRNLNKSMLLAKKGSKFPKRRGVYPRVLKEAVLLRADNKIRVPLLINGATPRQSAPPSLRIPQNNEERTYELIKLLSDPCSIEIDLLFDATEKFGGRVQGSVSETGVEALWISSFEAEGQFERIIGVAATYIGAAVLSIDGCRISDPAHFKKMYSSDSKPIIRVRCLFFDGTDLRNLDPSKLVESAPDKPNPRRQDGRPYSVTSSWGLTVKAEKSARPKVTGIQTYQESPLAKHTKRLSQETDADSRIVNKRLKTDRSKGKVDVAPVVCATKKLRAKKFNKYFLDRWSKAIAIEYPPLGIKLNMAASLMWVVHQDLFGDGSVCEAKCPCVFRLPKLAKGVISGYAIRKKNAGRVWSPSSPRIHFVDFFASRFLRRLRTEYSDEAPDHILKRLISMWRWHAEAFGRNCGKHCGCERGWENIFSRGRTVANRHQTPATKSGHAQHCIKQNYSIQRKVAVNEPEKSETDQYVVGPLDSQRPLGCYIITSASTAKIHSLDPRGQLSSYSFAQRGMTVHSAIVEHIARRVTGHVLLSKIYDEARRANKCISLLLSGHPSSKQDRVDGEWTPDGFWVGQATNGWSGGDIEFRIGQISKPTPPPIHNSQTLPMDIPQSPPATSSALDSKAIRGILSRVDKA